MSDNDDDKKPSRAGSIARSLLKPVAPWRSPMRTIGTSGIVDDGTKIFRNFTVSKRLCPSCGTPVTLAHSGDSNIEDDRQFVCGNCGWTQPISEAIAEAKEGLDGYRIAERQLLVAGLGIFATFTVLAIWGGSFFTFFGGAVVAFSLLSFALFYRYRYWQAESGSLFQSKAPIWRWLRDEISR